MRSCGRSRGILVRRFRSLSERVRRTGGLSELAVAAWTRRLVTGLAALHRRGIVHGDISAVTVITDGVRTNARGTLAPIGGSFSPLGSWSPERLCLAPPTEADDVWATGVFAYFLATASLPFAGQTGRELRRAIDAGERPSVRAFGVGTRSLDAFFDHVFAQDPSDRVCETSAFLRLLDVAVPAPRDGFGPPLTVYAEDRWRDAGRCDKVPASSGIV